MSGWSHHEGLASCLIRDNIDTDQLLPARFMSQPRSKGYGEFLFHDLRRDGHGKPDVLFPLNRHTDTSILVCGRNFGCGSSREAAVYALLDAGIQVVVSTRFGDIFAANAINNGLLPAVLDETDHARLIRLIGDGTTLVKVDLNTRKLSVDEHEFRFLLEESWRQKLTNGWDDIDLTLQFTGNIKNYRQKHLASNSWAWPHLRPDPDNTCLTPNASKRKPGN